MTGGEWPGPPQNPPAERPAAPRGTGDRWIGRADWALGGLDRLIKTILWLTLPFWSMGVLAFVPAAQAWFWTRSKGWLASPTNMACH